MLTKDLAAFQDVIKTFGVPLLNDRFDMLRQLGNSFIVQPKVLKSYLTEGHLERIDLRLLRPYLQQRTDWSKLAKEFGDEETLTSSKTEQHAVHATTSGLLKASRYSMGVGAAGMGKLKDMLRAMDEHAFGELNHPAPRRTASTSSAPGLRKPSDKYSHYTPGFVP